MHAIQEAYVLRSNTNYQNLNLGSVRQYSSPFSRPTFTIIIHMPLHSEITITKFILSGRNQKGKSLVRITAAFHGAHDESQSNVSKHTIKVACKQRTN